MLRIQSCFIVHKWIDKTVHDFLVPRVQFMAHAFQHKMV